MQRFNEQDIKRVVVRGANWVGDAVMTVPALRALRSLLPNAHITLATRSFANGIFADADFLDDLLIHDRASGRIQNVLQQARQWRERHFDLALIFPNAFESALVAMLGRVSHRIGYPTQGRGRLLNLRVALPEWREQRHESFYYLNIVAELESLLNNKAKPSAAAPVFDLKVSSQRSAVAREFLTAHGVGSGQKLIALCPGSINSRAKRWPADRYALLADRLIDELGADVVLIGSAAELPVSLEVTKQMRRQPIVLTGQTDLALAMAILNQVDLLVTNDTGPAHVAAALGRPTLVIFGPTNPLTTRPLSDTAAILRQPPDCAPCMLRDCPIDHRCMTAIASDYVFERAVAMLGKKSGNPVDVIKTVTPDFCLPEIS